jgi:transcriptional regulator with XRE-family HTH domain
MTQQDLAERMQAVGIDWERVTVAKFESGRRGFVRVDEALALCVTLGVSLPDLLVPADLDDDQDYRVVPTATARAVNVREFVRGEEMLFLFPYPEPERDPSSPFVEVGHMRVVDPIQWMTADRAERVDRRYADVEEDEDR